MKNDEQQGEEKRRGRGVMTVYDRNPFMGFDARQKTKRITNRKGDMMLINRDSGEIVNEIAGFWQSEEVDASKFVKLYINGVKALAELTGAGTKVFELLYLIIQENIGKDKVYVSFNDLKKYGIATSRPTFARGMAELINKEFIASTDQIGWYWLNPDYIWNGDRLAFVKEYRRAAPKPKVAADPRQLDIESAIKASQQQDEAALAVAWLATQGGLDEEMWRDFAAKGEPFESTGWKIKAWREFAQN